jgi:hypothetical protein
MQRAEFIPVGGVGGEIAGGLFGAGVADLGEPCPVGEKHRIVQADMLQHSPAERGGATLMGDEEEGPGAFAVALDQPGLDEQLEVARDARLRLAENGDEFGDGQLRLGEQREQAQPCLLARRGKGGEQGLEGGGSLVFWHGRRPVPEHIKICLYCKVGRQDFLGQIATVSFSSPSRTRLSEKGARTLACEVASISKSIDSMRRVIALLFSIPELPNSPLWFAGATGCFALLLFHGHSARNRENNRDSDPEDERPWYNIDKRPSADFAALIQTIRQEGAASRNEEKREDSGKEIREIITICLLIATLFGIYRQVDEMVKVYEPIKKQAEAALTQASGLKDQLRLAKDAAAASHESLVAAQRAWVGPTGGQIEGAVADKADVKIVVNYQNSGREPGIGFNYTIEPKIIGADDPSAGQWIEKNSSDCKNRAPTPGSQVVNPSNGGITGGGYQMRGTLGKSLIDKDVISGNKVIYVVGCFAYQTFAVSHHSSFCFFYKAGVSSLPNMNFCAFGNDAD